MKHVAFVTYELHPVNAGGVGVFLAGATRLLVRDGWQVSIIADMPEHELSASRRLYELENVGTGAVRFFGAEQLAGPPPQASSVYRSRAERFRRAIAELHRLHPIDLLELPEYAGIGVAVLEQRKRAGFLRGTRVVVRIHGSLELIDLAEHTTAEAERREMYLLERDGLRLAETVLAPTSAIGAHYVDFYGLDPRQLVVSPPPMEDLLAGLGRAERLPDPGHFLFYGKLQEVKGCVQLAEAAVGLMSSTPRRRWRFTFIGRDTPCATHRRMTSECMRVVIPGSLADQFEFLPAIDRLRLHRYTGRPVAAVVPSHFEAFCLAAHELRATGIPLVVPDIPAFRGTLGPENGCLVYDGTTNGLQRTLLRLRTDAEQRLLLEEAPRPRYEPFTAAYHALLRSPTARP